MRINATQAALDKAADGRSYAAAIELVEARERIVPLESRRLARLASIIAATPAVPAIRRRAFRDSL